MRHAVLKLSGLLLAGLLLVACQPIPLASPEAKPTANEAAQPKAAIPSSSTVTSEVDLSVFDDPAERQAAEEFLAAAMAKEQAFYAGDAEGFLAYYADDVVSVWPEAAEAVGKSAVAEGATAYLEGNQIVGNLSIQRIWLDGNQATRQAQWEEWVTPKDGGPGEHHIGRCTLVWEKIDGEWKVVSEFVNYLAPPAPIE
jgi:uncharacterized protein (TIGR02246 family)